MGAIKVKAWGEGQGDFVVIDEENFDPEFHVLYEAPAPEAPANLSDIEHPEQSAKPDAPSGSDENKSSEGAAAQSAPWATK